MNKFFSILAVLVTVAGFTSCTKDNTAENIDADNNGTVVYASTVAATKTTLSEDFRVVWSEGDEIKFVKDGDEDVTHIFTLTSGSGSTSGRFLCQDVVHDGTYTVYYPVSYDGTNWPEQKYVSPTDISSVPMKATATVTCGNVSAISFTNEGGILHYTLKRGKDWWDELINVRLWSDSPALDVELDCMSTNAFSGIEITKEGAVINIAVPEGEYHDATLELEGFIGGAALKASKLEVSKNMVYKAAFEVNPIERKQPGLDIECLKFLEDENVELKFALYLYIDEQFRLPLSNKQIEIKINKEPHYAFSDEKGLASIQLGVLPPGKYDVSAFCRGNMYYRDATAYYTIEVLSVK